MRKTFTQRIEMENLAAKKMFVNFQFCQAYTYVAAAEKYTHK